MHPIPSEKGLPKFILIPALLGITLLGVMPSAKAIAPIGDDAELFVTGVASVSENSNLFLSNTNTTSVTVVDLIPGLSYEFGKKDSLVTGQFLYTEDFQLFSKQPSQLDYELAHAVFWVKYDDTANKFNLDLSFQQADQAEVGIQNLDYLVNRDLYHADATDEVTMTEKTSVSVGAAFDDTHYRQGGYSDYYYTEIPANIYYQVEPKLDLSAGFRYRNNTVGAPGVDSEDYFYNVGARGEFTPLLTGQFNVGYQQATLDNGKKYNGLGADSKFTYSADPKTSIYLTVDDDFSYAATGDATRNISAALGFSEAVFDQWSVTGQVGYNDYSYITSARRDNFYSAQVGVAYKLTTNVSFSGTYTYGKDSSNVAIDNFNDSLFSISGALRF